MEHVGLGARIMMVNWAMKQQTTNLLQFKQSLAEPIGNKFPVATITCLLSRMMEHAGLGEETTMVNETTDDRSSPVQTVAYGTDWKQVDGGQDHSAAIKNDGTCWVWGTNIGDEENDGRLGTNDLIDRSSPVQTIMADTNWLYVSAGYVNTFGIRKA
jgi:hypothetical protein